MWMSAISQKSRDSEESAQPDEGERGLRDSFITSPRDPVA
jgi:hypothetical protein